MSSLALKQATYQDIIDLPNYVIGEILSPSTCRIDRIVKMPIYAELGVGYLWLIDPQLQTLEAYQLHDGHWLLTGTFADDQKVCTTPFAKHIFSLSNLWE